MRIYLSGVAFALIFAPALHLVKWSAVVTLSVLALSAWLLMSWRTRRKWRVHMGGSVAPGFEHVQQVYRQMLESQEERGSAFCVYHKGRKVVDLWGGYADIDALRYREEDSRSMYYSATKAMAAIVIALLVDRGLLDYKAKVTKYWPEFAQNGKEDVTLEMLLSHQAGVMTISKKHRLSLVRDDPEELGRLLARQKPLWKPGSATGYHALTYGLYADQLVRRVDSKKRSLASFFHDEIAVPLNLDFHIGEPKELYHRACRETRLDYVVFDWHYIVTKMLPTGLSLAGKMFLSLIRYRDIYGRRYVGNPTDWKPRRLNDPSFREIPSPASHGFGTARAGAKLMGVIACEGQLNGRRLLSKEGVQKLNTPLTSRMDVVVLRHLTYGPGTMILRAPEDPHGESHNVCGHWGAGGQMVFADPTCQLGWSYISNFCNVLHGFIVDHRYQALHDAMYKCVYELEKAK